MPWGTGPWGLTSWGSAPSALSFANALANSTNTILVTLSAEPKHTSGFDTGDALNPLTWQVVRLDTTPPTAFTVLAAREFDPPFQFEILVLEPLGDVRVKHRVSSIDLQAPSGIIITAPSSFDFDGLVDVDLSTPAARTATRRHTTRDLANPPAPSVAGAESIGGTLKITASGEYELEEGTPLLRKLIMRRLTTQPGEFFHLPDYGIGLIVKEPIMARNMFDLKRSIEEQVKLEPEVADAEATLRLSRDGVLTVQLRVQTRSGQDLNLGVELPSPGAGVSF